MRLKDAKKRVSECFGHLHFLKSNLEAAFIRAEADMASGFVSRNGEMIGVVSSDVSDPTSSIALGPKDEIEQKLKRLYEHLYQAERHLKYATYDASFLIGLPPEEAQRIAEIALRRTTECQHCKRIVANNPDDRLRVGRCRQCYDFYSRNGSDRELEPEKKKMGARMFGSVKGKTRLDR